MPFYCYNSKYILIFAVILDSDIKEDQYMCYNPQ